jgi:hypothetical protein
MTALKANRAEESRNLHNKRLSNRLLLEWSLANDEEDKEAIQREGVAMWMNEMRWVVVLMKGSRDEVRKEKAWRKKGRKAEGGGQEEGEGEEEEEKEEEEDGADDGDGRDNSNINSPIR